MIIPSTGPRTLAMMSLLFNRSAHSVLLSPAGELDVAVKFQGGVTEVSCRSLIEWRRPGFSFAGREIVARMSPSAAITEVK